MFSHLATNRYSCPEPDAVPDAVPEEDCATACGTMRSLPEAPFRSSPLLDRVPRAARPRERPLRFAPIRAVPTLQRRRARSDRAPQHHRDAPSSPMPTRSLPHDPIFRPDAPPPAAQPDAVAGAAPRTPGRAGGGGIGVRPDPPAHGRLGPALPRDRAILLRLARLRVLSLAELQALVFLGRDRSRLSRRLSRLEEAGWLQRWEEPRARGGRFRLVVPTATGLAWALARLSETTRDTRAARLVSTMLRAGRMAPLVLPPGCVPAFLPHLRDVNALLVAALRSSALHVAWASSWPRAFPSAPARRLPVPDGVLVLAHPAGLRHLVFLEHDRATESLRSFARTKVERYRSLASRPGLLEELTGHRSFRVLVTVGGDPASASGRLRALRRLVREAYAERFIQVVAAAEVLEEPARAFTGEGHGVPRAAHTEAPLPRRA